VVLEQDLEHVLQVTVEAAAAGQLALPRALYGELTRSPLSSREKQVLSLVVLGLSNAAIAAKLWLTESTVKSHLSSAFAKLGVRSRNEATSLILDPNTGLGTGILSITDGAARRPRVVARGR
jgi:DNA-binding NarL/FixJ family response regulator